VKRTTALALSLVALASYLPLPSVRGVDAGDTRYRDVRELESALLGKHKKELIPLIGPPDRMVDSHMTPSGTAVGPGVETKNLYESGLWIYEKPAFLKKDGSGPDPDIRELRIWFDMNDKVMTVTRE
jgi:hypothetical protein